MTTRAPLPEDLARLRIPTEPRLSPDGATVAFTVQAATARGDGYRHAVWLAPADGSSPARQATLGARHDRQPAFSPDGRTLAFLSDRRLAVEDEPDRPKDPAEREDGDQVHLLPLDGGEARRLTDLPRGVDGFAWSPDGTMLVVNSTSVGPTRAEDLRRRGKAARTDPAEPRESDYRYIDRLNYMFNGTGFTYDRISHLWAVDVASGAVRKLTDGPTSEQSPAWSPDGTRIAFAGNRHRDHDKVTHSDIWVVDVVDGSVHQATGGPDAVFFLPTWLPDGRTLAVLGGRHPNVYRADLWLFAADGSDAIPDGGRNLSGRHDLMIGAAMASDITVGEGPRLVPTADGAAILFTAPRDGSYELWRIGLADGALERLTVDRHYLSGWDGVAATDGGIRIAVLRSSPTETPDVWVLDVPPGPAPTATAMTLRPITALNADILGELDLRMPEDRWLTTDGQPVQHWFIASGEGRRPLVTEIHGGPHSLYGWSPIWEFQVLAGAGMGVHYSNPRGSDGYGLAFTLGCCPDWGDGPSRDVLAGVDALVAEGRADPARLGLTGGSYGGYLTNWILGHDDRFATAITCRSVSDMASLHLTGDISGVSWARLEFGATPWDDPELYRRLSPLTYAPRIRTPLLIQHAEKDLRCPIGQAEALFTVLREHGRPVRFMRVPDESHELTRSGTPFRRVENLVQVRAWFEHYLVHGRRRLPALPKVRAGR